MAEALTDHETFVRKWVEAYKDSRNQAWIAEELGLSRQAVSAKAQRLRSRGVQLPKLKAGVGSPQQIEPDRLNELINQEM
jgi:biotin operon repressor